jgi:transposase
MPRPTKLTRELIQDISKHVREGAPYSTAAALCGIGERTFHEWMAKGKDEDSGMHYRLSKAVDRANAELHAELAARFVSEARTVDGKAERFLARRFPNDWSEQQTHKIETDAPIELVVNLGRKLQLDDD